LGEKCKPWSTIVKLVSAVQFGLLTSVEMTTTVLIYIPVAYLADKGTKKPFAVMTFVFFSLFPLVFLFSTSITPLIIAFAVRGLKEFGEPTRKALIMDLAREDLQAAMFGLYYLLRDIFVATAAFGGALLWNVSLTLNLITAFGFCVVGTIWFIIFGSNVQTELKSDKGMGESMLSVPKTIVQQRAYAGEFVPRIPRSLNSSLLQSV
jgi:MFS family permease